MSEFMQLGRRDLLRHILVLAGASATASFSLEALASAAKEPKKFLGKNAFATLSAVADTIIPVTDTPGALAADVPARFDAMLSNWASPETRELVVGALARLDKAALAATGSSFDRLTPEARKAFLIGHDKASLQPVPPPPNASKGTIMGPLVSVVDNGYHRLKSLTITLYYASEIGLTQELVYEHVPGTWVPSLKITPGMHPFAGPNVYY